MEMLGAVYLSCCCFGISLLAFVLSYLLVEKVPEQEKSSVYECGFDPYEIARIPFSVRFFLVGILFIIFDLEVVFLFPWGVLYIIMGGWGLELCIYFCEF